MLLEPYPTPAAAAAPPAPGRELLDKLAFAWIPADDAVTADDVPDPDPWGFGRVDWVNEHVGNAGGVRGGACSQARRPQKATDSNYAITDRG